MRKPDGPIIDADVYPYFNGVRNPYLLGVTVETQLPRTRVQNLILMLVGAIRTQDRRGGDLERVSIPFERTTPEKLLKLTRLAFVTDISANRIASTPRSWNP